MDTISKINSILTWIPSHIDIHGNGMADKAARKLLLTDIQYKNRIH